MNPVSSATDPGVEVVFVRICLERGWVTREEAIQCLRGCDRTTARGHGRDSRRVSAPEILISRRLISRSQADTLLEEARCLLRAGVYSEAREEAGLGNILIRQGRVTPTQVQVALLIQSEFVRRRELVPLLGEILLQEGYLSPADLEEALRIQQARIRLRCEYCGTDYLVPEFDPRTSYLCRGCAGVLTRAQIPAAARVADPEEVQRAAANPKNRVGKYVATQELGRGGMGVVYKAWDTVLKRWVALKILRVAGGADVVIRFRREAETASLLNHPNIVPIYDVGQAAGHHFIAMKYIEGRPLQEERLPIERACGLIIQVARAIELAHSRNIVHRDLKPSNVLVDVSGRPYVMDFGLAKNLFESFSITAPGTVMGSPSYMSPEQAAGQVSRVDQRSDVYSLGALLYTLLTGRPPHKGETAVRTVQMILDTPLRPPTELNPEIPPELERIVLRALARDKANRYPSAGSLASDLERFLRVQPIPEKDEAPPQASGAPAAAPRQEQENEALKGTLWFLILLIGLAILALLVWMFFLQSP